MIVKDLIFTLELSQYVGYGALYVKGELSWASVCARRLGCVVVSVQFYRFG